MAVAVLTVITGTVPAVMAGAVLTVITGEGPPSTAFPHAQAEKSWIPTSVGMTRTVCAPLFTPLGVTPPAREVSPRPSEGEGCPSERAGCRPLALKKGGPTL
jgi:hypothetical protein